MLYEVITTALRKNCLVPPASRCSKRCWTAFPSRPSLNPCRHSISTCLLPRIRPTESSRYTAPRSLTIAVLFDISVLPFSYANRKQVFLSICRTCRITSYNVCYTKLLRLLRNQWFPTVFENKPSGGFKFEFFCYAIRMVCFSQIANLFYRITSYNVCYTKLLRNSTLLLCLTNVWQR